MPAKRNHNFSSTEPALTEVGAKDMSQNTEIGYSLMELLVSMVILVPIMAAAVGLLSISANQHATEQGSIEVNQEARAAFEMMTTEIAQAGSHGDATTTAASGITGNTATAQSVTVGSTTGIWPGDWVDVDTGTSWESAKITAVASTSLTGIFRFNHGANTRINLFALPFKNGLIPPAGMAASSSQAVSTLKFYGDILSDSTIQYVEYVYDSANNQITRSITPITAANKNSSILFISNVKGGSIPFTVVSDASGIINSVILNMTVQNKVKTGNQYEETELSSRVSIPSALSASKLANELLTNGGVDNFPATPTAVQGWAQ